MLLGGMGGKLGGNGGMLGGAPLVGGANPLGVALGKLGGAPTMGVEAGGPPGRGGIAILPGICGICLGRMLRTSLRLASRRSAALP